jgi:hypothetical protein
MLSAWITGGDRLDQRVLHLLVELEAGHYDTHEAQAGGLGRAIELTPEAADKVRLDAAERAAGGADSLGLLDNSKCRDAEPAVALQ